jgi:hypothetical protein
MIHCVLLDFNVFCAPGYVVSPNDMHGQIAIIVSIHTAVSYRITATSPDIKKRIHLRRMQKQAKTPRPVAEQKQRHKADVK